MRIQRKRLIASWRPKRLMTGLVVVFALLIGAGAMATPARAFTVTQVEHVCKQIGSADTHGNKGIICTDLRSLTYDNQTWVVGAVTEAICENSANTIVRCANITVIVQTADSSEVSGFENYACGHSPNALCPDGRYEEPGDSLPSSGAVSCIPNAWGVTVASVPLIGDTSIELPVSAKVVTLAANYGTPHAAVGHC